MMTERDRKIAEELKRRLSESVLLLDFRVFGSRARGDAEEDSDMDVFIEVEELTDEIKDKIRDIAYDIGFENDCMIITTLIYSRYELEESPMRSSFIVQNIFEEGVKI